MRQVEMDARERQLNCLRTVAMCFNMEIRYATLLKFHHWRVIDACLRRRWFHRLKKTDMIRLTGKGGRIIAGYAR